MSGPREHRGQRYARLHKGAAGDFDPREEIQREASATQQAQGTARSRAQALNYVRLPAEQLPALAWIAHQLCTLARKGDLPC